MEAPSPARLYAAAVAVLLVALGVLGFFYDASLGPIDRYEDAFAELQVNGWVNLFYVVTGAVALLVAGVASRGLALTVGLLYTGLAILGWGNETLQLVLGVLGLAAAAGTPGRGRSSKSTRVRSSKSTRVKRQARVKPRRSKPRAKAAGEGA